MSNIFYNIGAICVVSLICLPFIIKKSNEPYPSEKKREEEFDKDFDEKIHYLRDHEYMWRKKVK